MAAEGIRDIGVFDPEMVSAMSRAYDVAYRTIELRDGAEAAAGSGRALGLCIIALASEGVLDPYELGRRAVLLTVASAEAIDALTARVEALKAARLNE
jgi:hypothetical protein